MDGSGLRLELKSNVLNFLDDLKYQKGLHCVKRNKQSYPYLIVLKKILIFSLLSRP